jgi:tRNA 2-thiouridine synthesizing protein A
MKEINALGLRCPQPIIDIAKAIVATSEGESLLLLADDPATWPDLQAWARMTGNQVKQESETRFIATRRIQNVRGAD